MLGYRFSTAFHHSNKCDQLKGVKYLSKLCAVYMRRTRKKKQLVVTVAEFRRQKTKITGNQIWNKIVLICVHVM